MIFDGMSRAAVELTNCNIPCSLTTVALELGQTGGVVKTSSTRRISLAMQAKVVIKGRSIKSWFLYFARLFLTNDKAFCFVSLCTSTLRIVFWHRNCGLSRFIHTSVYLPANDRCSTVWYESGFKPTVCLGNLEYLNYNTYCTFFPSVNSAISTYQIGQTNILTQTKV